MIVNSELPPVNYGTGRTCSKCGKGLNSWHEGDRCYQCDGDGQHSIEDVWDVIRDDLELTRDLNEIVLQAICQSSYPIEPFALRNFLLTHFGTVSEFCEQTGLKRNTVSQQIVRGKLNSLTEGKLLEVLCDKEAQW